MNRVHIMVGIYIIVLLSTCGFTTAITTTTDITELETPENTTQSTTAAANTTSTTAQPTITTAATTPSSTSPPPTTATTTVAKALPITTTTTTTSSTTPTATSKTTAIPTTAKPTATSTPPPPTTTISFAAALTDSTTATEALTTTSAATQQVKINSTSKPVADNHTVTNQSSPASTASSSPNSTSPQTQGTHEVSTEISLSTVAGNSKATASPLLPETPATRLNIFQIMSALMGNSSNLTDTGGGIATTPKIKVTAASLPTTTTINLSLLQQPSFVMIMFKTSDNVTCSFGYVYSRDENSNGCVHMCKKRECQNGGQCYVEIGANNVTVTKCRCIQTSKYQITGDNCETAKMSRGRERGITLGVLLTLNVVFALTILCMCVKLKNGGNRLRAANKSYDVNNL